MSQTTKRPDTNDEAAARADLIAALDAVDAIRARLRPTLLIDTAGVPYCPWCGGQDLQHEEAIPSLREVLALDPDGALEINGHSEQVYEASTNERIVCCDCDGESCVDPALMVAWV